MTIPAYVTDCLDALEEAGYEAYLVGGCVRDMCLGQRPQDFDICTAAKPGEIQAVFADKPLVLAGVKHGTVGVVTGEGVVEITTFRTEGGYGDNRHPDWVDFVEDIDADLARRDFTVNAMAYAPRRGFRDPFGGKADLEAGILRAVGDPETRFREDALRILRGFRFAVRFRLALDGATWAAMVSQAPLMEHLAMERVYDELCKLLPLVNARDLVQFHPILSAVIPELGPMLGFDQHSPHHAYDLYTHTAHVVSGVPGDLTLRWAALLHDCGKIPCFTTDDTGRGHFYGHAKAGAEAAEAILTGLRAPRELRENAVTLIAEHMTRLEPDKRLLRRRLSKLGWEAMERLVLLQEADMGSKGTREHDAQGYFSEIRRLLDEIREEDACLRLRDLKVNGNDLMALGYEGKAIGACLQEMLDLILDETLPNERNALLAYARGRDRG